MTKSQAQTQMQGGKGNLKLGGKMEKGSQGPKDYGTKSTTTRRSTGKVK